MGIHCPPCHSFPLHCFGNLPLAGLVLMEPERDRQHRAVVPAAGTRSVTLEMRENKPGSPTELVLRSPFIPEHKTHKMRFTKLNPSSLPPVPHPSHPPHGSLSGADPEQCQAPGSSPWLCGVLGCAGGGAEPPRIGPCQKMGGSGGSTSNRETKVNCSATIGREGALQSLQAA